MNPTNEICGYANLSVHKAACLYALGLLKASQLPELSEKLLLDGLDSDCFADIVVSNDPAEYDHLFKKGLNDIGVDMPDKREAAICLAEDIAKEILGGRLSAYNGAYRIWKEVIDYIEPVPDELWPFKSEASAIEDSLAYLESYGGDQYKEVHKKLVDSSVRRILDAAHNLTKAKDQ